MFFVVINESLIEKWGFLLNIKKTGLLPLAPDPVFLSVFKSLGGLHICIRAYVYMLTYAHTT